MVKEVEIVNTVESIKTGYSYPPYVTDASIPMLTGYLTDSGNLLTVEVNREVASKSIRLVHLWHALVDAAERKVDYTLLETKNTIVDSGAADGVILPITSSIHAFDISSVLTIPRRIGSIPTTGEITVDLFTYEANVVSCDGTALYGTKRLSVPYNSSADYDLTFPTSTDGWLPIGVIDYAVRDLNESYTAQVNIGDIVYWYTGAGDSGAPNVGELKTGSLYVAQEKTEESPAVDGKWLAVEEADILRMMSMPLSPTDGTATAVIGADALLTRYVKQEIIQDMLKRLSFKEYDDVGALRTLMIITALREKAIVLLEAGDQIRATYLLDKIDEEYNSFASLTRQVINTRLTALYTL